MEIYFLMHFIKNNNKTHPKVSLVLLDWGVRESFHIFHYLRNQNVPRDQLEIIFIEFYSGIPEALKAQSDMLDKWILLEMPEDCYYHKHLMYNVGIAFSRGEIITVCDSDAMVEETFTQSIVSAFMEQPDIVLHIDQFRNNSKIFYPFSFPTFQQVRGRGCINNVKGKTRGILETKDPTHSRNYGACMSALRKDLISIGGADEHIDFLGHICGPYDMTFRLFCMGKREVWLENEFTYHTWHPGQGGDNNFIGPHDGKHISTTSLAALKSRRTQPLKTNLGIEALRDCPNLSQFELENLMINPENIIRWKNTEKIKLLRQQLINSNLVNGNEVFFDELLLLGEHNGYHLTLEKDEFFAEIFKNINMEGVPENNRPKIIKAKTLKSLQAKIDSFLPEKIQISAKRAMKIAEKRFVITHFYLKIRAGLGFGFRALRYRNLESLVTFFRKIFYFPSFLKKRGDDVRKILDDVQGSMSSVSATLYFIGQNNANRMGPKAPLPLVLFNLAAQKKFLRSLQKDPEFPDFFTKQINRKGSLKTLLQTIENEDGDQKVLILESLHTRFISVFMEAKIAKQFIIV